MRPLTPQQLIAVTEHVSGKTKAEAARIAGYSPAYNVDQLFSRPAVAKAVEDARAKQQEKSGYTIKRAVEELDMLIDEARKARQYSAVAKLTEAKLKIHGFLSDSIRLRMEEGPSLVAALALARARSDRYLEAIDVPTMPVLPARATSTAESPRDADIFRD